MNAIPAQAAGPLGANPRLAQLVNTTRQPNGLARLSPSERKLLFAAILASMVPADNRITDIEVEQLRLILGSMLHLSADFIKVSTKFVDSGLAPEDLLQAARQLPELLGPEDRINMVKALWEIALSDGELHTAEEALAFAVADSAQVPRKRVVEAQSRASRRKF